ncbi:uncharacterized protein LOC119437304 [Dermacentor silvarum]|uniref:uncharacterized protein LOC119437304 n=1 Tax=Dermacentor silvarum TaxID=543639 RepID=UPI00189AA783|nr:uncharacterized protein LOC119437304 [Dermacentor silvarum]
MSGTPKRRKLYLEPFFDGDELPRSTRYRASRLAANTSEAQSVMSDSVRAADESAGNSPVRVYDWSNGEVDECEEFGQNVDEERLAQNANEDREGEDDGCSSDFSAGDIVTLVMDFAVNFGLAWTQVEHLMKLVSFLLKRNDLPDTKFLFKKFAGVSTESMVFHFYCPECMCLLGECDGDLKKRKEVEATCEQCKQLYTGDTLTAQGSFFVSLPMGQQLASILSSAEISRSLKNSLDALSHRSEATSMTDITDGSLYRQQRKDFGLGAMDLTMTINSDGSPIFNSSKFSIWPVQTLINELPPGLRSKNVTVAMLWYGQCHPDMTLVLEAFSKQMDSLAESGIKWTCDGETFHSKVYCFTGTADAPARALMQNTVQYNGYFGCGWCLHPGKCIEGTVKYPVSATALPDRTKEGMIKDMAEAHRSGVHVRGVKGPSPLINLAGFDIVWGFTPNYMHCVLLGVTRQFMELWLSGVGAPYYIGSPHYIRRIDERLCAIKPPQCITRLPTSVQLRKFWKASEWQQWLLYFSLVCLDGMLPGKYMKHFSLLVKAMHLLLADTVSAEDINQSTECLVQFVVKVQFLYSKKEMTSNVHLLLHLAKSASMQGPLWAHSCFVFEAGIGKIKKLITSAKGVPHQVMSRVLMANKVGAHKAAASRQVQNFLCCDLRREETLALLGKPKPASVSLCRLIEAQVPQQITGPVEEHDRVRISGRVFHSEQYQRPDRTDCTAVRLPDNMHAKIKHIVSVSCSDRKRIYFVSKSYVSSLCFGTTHISSVQKWGAEKVIEVDSRAAACLWIECDRRQYFCNLVNRFQQ